MLIRLSYMAAPILALFYKGDNFQDPIDGRKYRKLLPYGYKGRQRENALAPASLSLERHRLLWLYLQKRSNFFSEKQSVLHVAPEQCFYGRFRKMKNLDYLTADLDSPIADVKMDIHDIQYEDNHFDVVFCNHVLEHIPNDKKAMQELYRVLKKGGFGIFQIPQDLSRATTFEDDSITDKKQRAEIFGQYDHVRIYGRDYFDQLRAVGFRVDEVDYTRTLTPDEVDRYRLAPGEILPVCYK